MAEEQPGWQLERIVSFGATIIAPATVLSGLLFYFGYVSSREQYEYFGIDVDTIGLSTQDYVMRSPQPLLFPLLVLTLLGLGGLRVHVALARRITAATSDSPEPDRLLRYERIARRAVIAGWAVVGLGAALVASYAVIRGWAAYNLVTPLVFTVGAALIAYASRMAGRLHPSELGKPTDVSAVALRRAGTALVFAVIVANVFWATATVAQWSGRGLAHYQATHLDHLPSVILDTQERLYLRSPGIEETVLPPQDGQTFHYRYRHLRLLIQGHGLMFLVPDQWSASNSTLVVPLDDSVRVQFQFRNDAP